jgi:hypothetical protein
MYQLHASAAKAGVDVLTRNLACEWGPSGVRVVGVAPGIIGETEGFSRLGGASADGQQSGALCDAVPLGRLGHSDDIAAAVVFLCRLFGSRFPSPPPQSPHARSTAPPPPTYQATRLSLTEHNGCTTAGSVTKCTPKRLSAAQKRNALFMYREYQRVRAEARQQSKL